MRTRRLSTLAAVLALLAALLPSAAGAAFATSTTMVVKPSAMHGWFFYDDTHDSLATATGDFTIGPASAPLGSGSAHLTVASSTDGQALVTPVTGFNFADISTLSYSTYRSSADAGNNLAISFQLNIDYSPTDANTGWQGRLVFEPYNGASGTVVANTWQTWNALNGQWWASKTTSAGSNGLCPQLSPCTWSQVLANWPNARINPVAPAIVLKAGSGWAVFDGNVDNLTIGVSGDTTTYDFEPETPCTTACYVNAATGNDAFGGDTPSSAKKTIQAAVNQVSSGGTVHVAAGTYVENVVVGNAMTIIGAGQASTIVEPVTSNPNCGGAGGGSLCAGGSNVFLVQADNVTVTGLTIDGDNPALTSTVTVAGANIDARNGIITNHTLGLFNGLDVHDVTVRNIYLRGIYASSSGTFNFHNDTVTNVQADLASVAMFAYGGPGTMAHNTVSGANDAISANNSKGIAFIDNVVTDSQSGVHTDNTGNGGGVADVIAGNTVSCSAGGYGVWVYVPYIAPTVHDNSVTNCYVGLGAFGGAFAPSPTVTTTFSNNRVDGGGAAGSVGVLVQTGTFGYGNTNVAATFVHNTIVHNATGVQVDESLDPYYGGPAQPLASATIALHYNVIAGNSTIGLTTNSVGQVDAINNWWGCSGGPGAGCNGVSSNVDASPWLVDTLTVSPSLVAAGATTSATVRADLTHDSTPGAAPGTVPDGTPVTFTLYNSANALLQTATATTSGGMATATFSGLGTLGSDVYEACAQVPTTYGALECTPYVVYDASAGFVTGGGWISSPAGAYTADPTLSGKATFGFVSKYQKGASVPTGSTHFVFQTGNLDFSSTSYQWLVVNQGGTNAQFKGTGTINGTGSYGFMIWATEATASAPATFRIQITNGGTTVYDNGPNEAIGGGSIIVHT